MTTVWPANTPSKRVQMYEQWQQLIFTMYGRRKLARTRRKVKGMTRAEVCFASLYQCALIESDDVALWLLFHFIILQSKSDIRFSHDLGNGYKCLRPVALALPTDGVAYGFYRHVLQHLTEQYGQYENEDLTVESFLGILSTGSFDLRKFNPEKTYLHSLCAPYHTFSTIYRSLLCDKRHLHRQDDRVEMAIEFFKWWLSHQQVPSGTREGEWFRFPHHAAQYPIRNRAFAIASYLVDPTMKKSLNMYYRTHFLLDLRNILHFGSTQSLWLQKLVSGDGPSLNKKAR